MHACSMFILIVVNRIQINVKLAIVCFYMKSNSSYFYFHYIALSDILVGSCAQLILSMSKLLGYIF